MPMDTHFNWQKRLFTYSTSKKENNVGHLGETQAMKQALSRYQ